jgi:hypothetical protein
MTRKKRSSMARFPWPSPGDFVSCSSSSLYSSKKSVHLITSIVTKCFSKALYPPTHYPLNQHCHLTSLSQKFRSPQSMLQLVYSFLIQNTTDFSLCSNSISRHLIQLLVMSLTACADLLETDNRIIAQSNCSNISTWKLQGCVWNSQFSLAHTYRNLGSSDSLLSSKVLLSKLDCILSCGASTKFQQIFLKTWTPQSKTPSAQELSKVCQI